MQGPDIRRGSGRLIVVGTGPGSVDHLTPAARRAIEVADIVVGYGTYLDLIREAFPDKEYLCPGTIKNMW